MNNLISRLAVVLLVLGMMTLPVMAQSSYGSVVGTITDSTGAAVPGAAVVLVNAGTSERRSMDTDSVAATISSSTSSPEPTGWMSKSRASSA